MFCVCRIAEVSREISLRQRQLLQGPAAELGRKGGNSGIAVRNHRIMKVGKDL